MSKENDLVSVVIPAYNAEKFIAYAVSSVFMQKHRPIELIIVNDGSHDSTLEQITRNTMIKDNSIEINIIDLEKNSGAANALNIGFSTARGDYICWLSADDIFIDPDKLTRQIYQMKLHNANLCYSSDYYKGKSDRDATIIRTSFIPNMPFLDKSLLKDPLLRTIILVFHNPINGSSVMIDKNTVSEYGSFDSVLKNIDADGDLWMRYSSLGLKFCTIQGPAVFYRDHEKQVSKRKLNMTYGKDLTRRRLLNALERKGVLIKTLKRFELYSPLFFIYRLYNDIPFTTKFLCEYIIKNEKSFDKPYCISSKIILNKVNNYLINNCFDQTSFEEDLQLACKTAIFKKFNGSLDRVSL